MSKTKIIIGSEMAISLENREKAYDRSAKA
jgi:hypothetical protein